VRAASTLDALVSAWAQVAHGQQATVKELAIEFCRTLEGQPELIGVRIRAKWIEDRYPLFCAALGVRSPPPFKDFARELAEQMDRERADVRRKGKRESFTTYCVPKATVVALSQEMQQASLALCLDPAAAVALWRSARRKANSEKPSRRMRARPMLRPPRPPILRLKGAYPNPPRTPGADLSTSA